MGIKVTSVRSMLKDPSPDMPEGWPRRGVVVADVEAGGYGYLHELVRLLTQSPHADVKAAGMFLAESTGLAVDGATLDLNSQVARARDMEAMRDFQLSDLQRRLRELWERSQRQDHRGYHWTREELMEGVEHLSSPDFMQESGRRYREKKAFEAEREG
jgi:hypothetical protein